MRSVCLIRRKYRGFAEIPSYTRRFYSDPCSPGWTMFAMSLYRRVQKSLCRIAQRCRAPDRPLEHGRPFNCAAKWSCHGRRMLKRRGVRRTCGCLRLRLGDLRSKHGWILYGWRTRDKKQGWHEARLELLPSMLPDSLACQGMTYAGEAIRQNSRLNSTVGRIPTPIHGSIQTATGDKYAATGPLLDASLAPGSLVEVRVDSLNPDTLSGGARER